MNETLEVILGASLLFGTENIISSKRYDTDFQKRLDATTKWAAQYKNIKREQQIFDLLQTEKGRNYIRNEVFKCSGVPLEFSPPLLKQEIIDQMKWALTLMIANEGIVPSWQQGTVLYVGSHSDYGYMQSQLILLERAGCDITPLKQTLNDGVMAGCLSKSDDYRKRIKEAQRIREGKIITAFLKHESDDVEKELWFSGHVDDEYELELYRSLGFDQEEYTSTTYSDTWKKLNMNKYNPGTWRKDAKRFYQKWIVLWKMAEEGKIPSWQVNWVPNYYSDYLCFVEQIIILDRFGHEPWPLAKQIPSKAPQNHRTLEEVIFKR